MRKLALFSLFTFCLVSCTFYLVLCTLIGGCNPTYPKEYVDNSIVDLCKKEYGVDVKVKVIGRTIGVHIPIKELVDKSLTVTAHAIEKVDDVVMSVSRVALSTDADFNFYVVIAQDPDMPELELVIIRYVEDVKRFLVMDISRDEYFDRVLTELKLTPQVQKEKIMRGLFERMGTEVSDKIIEEYFKSGYIDTISDIGYWNGKFFLKDLTMGEFLARQIEGRLRRYFSKSEKAATLRLNYINAGYKNGFFDLGIDVDSKPPYQNTQSDRMPVLKDICDILSRVLGGYKFEEYSQINIMYEGGRNIITKEDMVNLKKRRIKPEDIIQE